MIYVDETRWKYGRLKMCHMVADSSEELLDFGEKLELKHSWLQKAGTAEEHFDICKGKRAMAISLGARSITSQELVAIIRTKRGT